MTEPVDITPPPPARKYDLADYLFQFIVITAGVLIALLLNSLVEWNNNRALVDQAVAVEQGGAQDHLAMADRHAVKGMAEVVDLDAQQGKADRGILA